MLGGLPVRAQQPAAASTDITMPTLVSIPFGSFGASVMPAPAQIVGLQWQVNSSSGMCTVELRIDDIAFIPARAARAARQRRRRRRAPSGKFAPRRASIGRCNCANGGNADRNRQLGIVERTNEHAKQFGQGCQVVGAGGGGRRALVRGLLFELRRLGNGRRPRHAGTGPGTSGGGGHDRQRRRDRRRRRTGTGGRFACPSRPVAELRAALTLGRRTRDHFSPEEWSPTDGKYCNASGLRVGVQLLRRTGDGRRRRRHSSNAHGVDARRATSVSR